MVENKQPSLIFYRLDLSYGIPSAFGALEFLEVKVKMIRHTIYGSILYTVEGRCKATSNGNPV